MKKMYLFLAIAFLSVSLNAQTAKKTVKKAATSKPAEASAKVVPHDHSAHAAINNVEVSSSASATTPVVDASKPVAEDNLELVESTFDFGKIKQGIPVYHDFTIKNIGKGELKLDNVVAGCGCTTPTWAPGPYKAGESAVIKVGFNAGAVGPFTKAVTVTYNGGLTKTISFNGEVLAPAPAPAPENKGVQILKG
jgi:hypothetical protein